MADDAKAQEALFALRAQIAKLEGKALPAVAAADRADTLSPGKVRKAGRQALLRFGVANLDEALSGGLPLDAITEIRSRSLYDAGAACGFALSLAASLKRGNTETAPVLWISDGFSVCEAGALYAGGLQPFGIDPHSVFHATPRRLDDALWLAEAALASGAFSATILIIHGNPKPFGLAESRRLNLRAKAAGRPLFLLRQAGSEEASSAVFRLLVEPAPAVERRLADGSMLGGSIGNPVFRLTLEKSRNPAPLSLSLEWNPRDRQFYLAREAGKSRLLRQRPAHHGTQFSLSADRQNRASALGHLLAFEKAS